MSEMTVLIRGGSDATLLIDFNFTLRLRFSCFSETSKGGGS